MKVRRSSWHYRLWRLGRENSRSEPRDLCRYFWHLALIKVLLPLTVVALAIGGVVSIVWIIWENPIETAITVGLLAIAIAIVVGAALWAKSSQERQIVESLSPPKEKKPSVLRQYLSARKRKVCPLIEVVDD